MIEDRDLSQEGPQEPEDVWKDCDPDRVQAALRASAGAFAGIDIEALIEDIEAQREQGPERFD